MTDQPTRTDATTTRETPPSDQGADAREVTGTRELRDAQVAAKRQDRERPPIRARGDATGEAERDAPLFDEEAGRKLRERWMTIQTEFVDEPRGAVEKADTLVAEVLKQLTDTFARERDELEAGWSRSGDDSKPDVSTEELRQAIQRYRSFFNRLLTL